MQKHVLTVTERSSSSRHARRKVLIRGRENLSSWPQSLAAEGGCLNMRSSCPARRCMRVPHVEFPRHLGHGREGRLWEVDLRNVATKMGNK